MAVEEALHVLKLFADMAANEARKQEAAPGIEKERTFRDSETRPMYHAEEDVLEEFNKFMSRFPSLHKTCGAELDWLEVRSRRAPLEPENNHPHEREAETKRKEFRPSFSDKLFHRTESKRKILDELVAAAKREDQTEYDSAMAKYREEHEQWSKLHALSERMLAGDRQAYVDAPRELNVMHNLEGVCKSAEVRLYKNNVMEVLFEAFGLEIVPQEKPRPYRSDRLSFTDMPKGEYYELYRDYVCSATLRIARELLAVLPIDLIIVTAMTELLNTSTGQLQQQPTLSSAIARDTLKKINFERVRPSDCFSNFVHNMNFKKLSGFSPTTKLEPTRFANCSK